MRRSSIFKTRTEVRRTIAAIALGALLFGLMMASAILAAPNTSAVKISKAQHMAHPPIDIKALSNVVNPPNGYTLPVQYGQMGPKLLEAGVIEIAGLKQQYQQTGQVLSDKDIDHLIRGSQEPIVINQQNAPFLLTLFWGVGLSNQNPIIDKSSNLKSNDWTVGRKSGSDLFSSTVILKLSSDQQARVEELAKAVYRPCSDTSTLSPDNKYSIAILGLLEFMASQDVSSDEMFSTVKQVNAFWFPQQTLEQAIFFVATQLKDYVNVDARWLTSQQYFSATGFRQLHQWLKDNGMLGDESDAETRC
jgi:hypothetical protein